MLPKSARHYLTGYAIVSSAITAIDAVAMAVLALIIAPVVSGSQTIHMPIVGEVSAAFAPALAGAALVALILKSVITVVMQWFVTRRFSAHEQDIGDRLFHAYIHSSWEERSRRTAAEVTRIADAGIANTMAGFLMPLSRVPSAFFTFVLVILVLFVIDPVSSVIALSYLMLVAFLVHRVVTRRVLEAGEVNLYFSYRVANLMTEMIEALKELSLRNRLDQVAGLVGDNRRRAVRARANGSFLSVIPGFAFEVALIGGVLLVGLFSFIQGGMAAALAAVALFAATGFRLIPALTGLQAGLVQATASLPSADEVIQYLESAESDMQASSTPLDTAVLPESPELFEIKDVRFRYHGATEDVIRGLSLSIPLGSSVGIVGPSGAGKSTLVDLILGLSQPSSGEVLIDGNSLTTVLRAWRNRVGYVPQRVALFDGTIAQNVALSWSDDVDHERVESALRRAQLESLVTSREGGIHARIGERGMTLSGGQQQRLGIARALYTDPLVLVLDEATSSLDTKTEDEVTKAIRSLQGQVTLISVAHRLSTIKDYDRICYVDHGVVQAQGTFGSVAQQHPEFKEQVALAGLLPRNGQ
ncbi:MAG: ABC transporter ATP-binding protein [Microbacteriaceae bacterium]